MTRAVPRTREDQTMTATAKREASAKGKVGAKAAEEEPKAKGGLLKNKKFLLLLVLVLVVGGAAYKMLMPAPPPGPPKAGDTVVLDPLTLNLTDGHYLQVSVAVQLVQGKATKDKFETSPADQLIINEFSNRTVASLSSDAAREKSLTQLKKGMDKEYPGAVFKLFYTKFVTQ
jgi:flagellar FliL protein